MRLLPLLLLAFPASLLLGCPASAGPELPLALRVMTFNAGTTEGLPHDAPPDDGYTSAHAAITDDLYENSLSWNPAEAALRGFLAEHEVDVVVFQEVFDDRWCADIDVDPELDFVCRDHDPEGPSQPQRLLGPDFVVACAPGQPDNCAGLRRSVGTFVGCEEGLCLEGMGGMGPPSGCSNGARVSRAAIELADGGGLTLVNVHGTSGLSSEDRACRADQFAQVFEDRGDGEPAASGERNLVMGDLNTDPLVLEGSDPSAAKWLEHVGEGRAFHWISDPSPDSPPTYADLFRIDHVVSDSAVGSCFVAGVTAGHPAVLEAVYWDHKPVVCDVELPAP